MAKAKKKTDEPMFRMIIHGGHLVPAFQAEAERLDTWINGTKVLVTFSHDADRVLVRKWWAVIGAALKGGNLPWENKEAASAAIKLALGMIDVTKTTDGKWMQFPRSLTEFNDAELEHHCEMMMALLYRMTGVDFESRTHRHLIESEMQEFTPDYPQIESSDVTPTEAHASVSDDGSGDAQVSTPSDSVVGATNPEEAIQPAMVPDAEPDSAGDQTASSSAVPGASLQMLRKGEVGWLPFPKDDVAWLTELAKMLVAAAEPGGGEEHRVLIKVAGECAKGRMPEGGISAQTKATGNKIYKLCLDAAESKAPLDLKLISTLAGCRPSDIALKDPAR